MNSFPSPNWGDPTPEQVAMMLDGIGKPRSAQVVRALIAERDEAESVCRSLFDWIATFPPRFEPSTPELAALIVAVKAWKADAVTPGDQG